jgi:hypothetical protein
MNVFYNEEGAQFGAGDSFKQMNITSAKGLFNKKEMLANMAKMNLSLAEMDKKNKPK